MAVNDLPSKKAQVDAVVAEINSKGRRAHGLTGDVSVDSYAKSMVEETVGVFGGLDVMVANAGVLTVAPLLETSVADYDRLMSVNARGVFLCFKHAGSQMVKQGKGGRIIGASSLAGVRGFANMSLYSMSKFAVRGLTEAYAGELQQHKITVNSYGPGLVTTDLVMNPVSSKLMGINKDTLLTDSGTVAGLVSYLIRPEAHWITGQTVVMDGGLGVAKL